MLVPVHNDLRICRSTLCLTYAGLAAADLHVWLLLGCELAADLLRSALFPPPCSFVSLSPLATRCF